VRALDQRVAERRDAICDTLKKLGTDRERQMPVRVERSLREFAGRLDILHRAAAEHRLGDVGSRGGIERAQRFFLAAHRFATNQHFAGNRHFAFLEWTPQI
jgi:hypothetical protein